MALILCHGPKGGTGTTFLSAHLAMGLTGLDGSTPIDGDVSLMTLSSRDLTPLHFGLPPAQRLPGLNAGAESAVLVNGISLRCEPEAPYDADFVVRLQDAGFLTDEVERTLVLDVPAGERELARKLMPYATVHVCPITATPDCLALLPQVLDENDGEARQSAYIIGKLDETRRLARHVAAFMREILGNRLIGKIRQDQSVPEALAMLQMLGKYAPSSAALADARLASDTIGLMLAASGQETAETADAHSGATAGSPRGSRVA